MFIRIKGQYKKINPTEDEIRDAYYQEVKDFLDGTVKKLKEHIKDIEEEIEQLHHFTK